jgi:hypothetical protein
MRSKTVKPRSTKGFLPVPMEPLPEPLQQVEQDLLPAFQPPFRIGFVAFNNPMLNAVYYSYFFHSFCITAPDLVVERTNSHTLKKSI